MKRAIVVGEYRLFLGPDGNHYAESVFGRQFWERYLEVFDRVLVVARVEYRPNVTGLLRVDDELVQVYPLPNYVGMGGYLRRFKGLRDRARSLVELDGTMILRLPGPVGSVVHSLLPRDRPFGVELVGDPADVFGKGVVEHPLRRLIRFKLVRDLRRQCRGATAIGYVSKYQLEGRYPPNDRASTFAYSSATLPQEAFAAAPRTFSDSLTKLVAVGSMDQMYKGFDTLLMAFSSLVRDRPTLTLSIAGGGRYLQELKQLANELGVGESVSFAGSLADPAKVWEFMDAGHLFVSSSRTEGLPRTIIEAQARGLATIGTRVGSTPELLPEHDMCPSNDPVALAGLISELIDDPRRATRNASRGFENARRYGMERLQAERNRMFRALDHGV